MELFTRLVVTWITASVLAASIATAQAPPRRSSVNIGAEQRQEMALNMLSSNLSLNDSQKQQLTTFFKEARQTAEPIQNQILVGRKALLQAIRDGKSQNEIERLTGDSARSGPPPIPAKEPSHTHR